MKKIMLASAAAALLVFSSIGAASADTIRGTEVRQQQRIHQGVRAGEITTREYRHLERGQARIAHARRAAWRDGRMSRAENRRIRRLQNRQSCEIYRARHNGYYGR